MTPSPPCMTPALKRKRSQCPVASIASRNAGSIRSASRRSQTTPADGRGRKARGKVRDERVEFLLRPAEHGDPEAARGVFLRERAPQPVRGPDEDDSLHVVSRLIFADGGASRPEALRFEVPVARHVQPEREARVRAERRVEACDPRVRHLPPPEAEDRDLLARPRIEPELPVPAEKAPERVGGVRAEALLAPDLLLDLGVGPRGILPAPEVQRARRDTLRERREIRRPVAELELLDLARA